MAKPKAPKKINEAVVAPIQSAAAALPEVQTSTRETVTAQPQKSTRKPVIVRTETRANLVPINVEEEIRRLAYLLSERRGFEPGHDAEDWLAAEREVRDRYHQQSA